jgi:FAD synthetase
MSPSNKVVVWGTFDLFHQGHFEFLFNASKFGDLYVIVIPDFIAFINKKHKTVQNQLIRYNNIKQLEFVKGVYIDSLSDGLRSLNLIKPDFFCLGYDQFTSWENELMVFLSLYFPNIKIIRLKEYADGIHTSKLQLIK